MLLLGKFPVALYQAMLSLPLHPSCQRCIFVQKQEKIGFTKGKSLVDAPVKWQRVYIRAQLREVGDLGLLPHSVYAVEMDPSALINETPK